MCLLPLLFGGMGGLVSWFTVVLVVLFVGYCVAFVLVWFVLIVGGFCDYCLLR